MLGLPDLLMSLSALTRRRHARAVDQGVMLMAIYNAPHFRRKDDRPYSLGDFVTLPDEARRDEERAGAFLSRWSSRFVGTVEMKIGQGYDRAVGYAASRRGKERRYVMDAIQTIRQTDYDAEHRRILAAMTETLSHEEQEAQA